MNQEEIQGQNYFNLKQRIIEREKDRRTLFIENLPDLSLMFDSNLYKTEFEDWAGFLGEIEIFYSRNEVDTWRRIYDRFKELEISPEDYVDVPISRLDQIRQFAEDKEIAIDLLDKAKVLTSRDWKDEIAEKQGRPVSANCSHDYKLYEICKQGKQ